MTIMNNDVNTRIAAMHTSRYGFRDEIYNDYKCQFALDMMTYLSKQKTDLVVFPAGYFITETENEIEPYLNRLFDTAEKLNMGIVIGVDLLEVERINFDSYETTCRIIEQYLMPCFLYTYEPGGNIQIWRQRLFTPWQAKEGLVSDHLLKEKRSILINDKTIEFWLCGECFSDKIVEASRKRKPDAVYVPGHITMPRFRITLRRLLKSKLTILHSEHRTNPEGLHYKAINGKDKSERTGFLYMDKNGFWSELSVLEI